MAVPGVYSFNRTHNGMKQRTERIYEPISQALKALVETKMFKWWTAIKIEKLAKPAAQRPSTLPEAPTGCEGPS